MQNQSNFNIKSLNRKKIMEKLKNFKFIVMAMFVALLSMSLTACSDDDDDAPMVNNPINQNPTDSTTVNPNPTDTINSANSIVGSWKSEYPYDDAYDGGTDAGTIVEVYKFNSNGTAKYTYKKNNRNGEPIEYREIDFTYQYTYNEDGKGTLIGNYNGETSTYIIEIIGNKLYAYDGRGTMEFTRVQ